jgi:hypothetical protein
MATAGALLTVDEFLQLPGYAAQVFFTKESKPV